MGTEGLQKPIARAGLASPSELVKEGANPWYEAVLLTPPQNGPSRTSCWQNLFVETMEWDGEAAALRRIE